MAESHPKDNFADPRSLLGMLQRGRGAGYLAALRAPRETVWTLLVHCLTHDPRLDKDAEDRAEYYASLILATEMDVGPLGDWQRDNDTLSQVLPMQPRPVLQAFGHLAGRGNPKAVDILRDYVSYGREWVDAMKMLSNMDPPTTGLDDLLLKRLKDDPGSREQFKEDMTGGCRWPTGIDREGRTIGLHALLEPWKALREKNPQVAEFFDGLGLSYVDDEERAGPNLEGLSLEELFASADESSVWRRASAVAQRVSREDEAFLLQHLSAQNKYEVMLAFWGLGAIGTAKAFEAVRAFIATSADADRQIRAQAIRAFAEMPASLALDTARQWFLRDEWYLQVPAGRILENHATTDDILMLVETLHRSQTFRREDFRLGSALDALALFDGYGLIPELEQVFVETPCCFDRHRAANAMAATASEIFARQYALECLWDCHWDTRGLGCASVPVSLPGALERLREIAADRQEHPDVREAARERLDGF